MDKKIDFFSTNDDIAHLLSSRIKDERIMQELKQSELALKANVKVHVIRNLEQHSKISLDNLISILRALKKVDIFNEMFNFAKERIEVDAFNYAYEQSRKTKKRVKSAKKEL